MSSLAHLDPAALIGGGEQRGRGCRPARRTGACACPLSWISSCSFENSRNIRSITRSARFRESMAASVARQRRGPDRPRAASPSSDVDASGSRTWYGVGAELERCRHERVGVVDPLVQLRTAPTTVSPSRTPHSSSSLTHMSMNDGAALMSHLRFARRPWRRDTRARPPRGPRPRTWPGCRTDWPRPGRSRGRPRIRAGRGPKAVLHEVDRGGADAAAGRRAESTTGHALGHEDGREVCAEERRGALLADDDLVRPQSSRGSISSCAVADCSCTSVGNFCTHSPPSLAPGPKAIVVKITGVPPSRATSTTCRVASTTVVRSDPAA